MSKEVDDKDPREDDSAEETHSEEATTSEPDGAEDEADSSEDESADEAGDESADEADEADSSEDESAEAAPKGASKSVPAEDPERMRRARPRGQQPVAPPPPAASLGKSVFLFLGVFVVLAAGFAFLSGNDPFTSSNVPRWRKGQKVQLNITLDPRDDVKLACASKTVLDGKRCEYETKTERFAGENDEAKLLRPYTTTDGVQFLAAGLWSAPELQKGKRPSERFTVACTLTVDGSIGSPAVRWDPAGSWNEKNQPWFGGSVSECKLVKE